MTRAMPRHGKRSRRKIHHHGSKFVVEGMRRILLNAASRREIVTYGTLIRAFGLSRGRALTRMISAVDQGEYAINAPGFAAIVVRKDTRYPGGGYFCDDALPVKLRRPASGTNDPRLSLVERDYVRRKQEEIWAYYARTSLSARR